MKIKHNSIAWQCPECKQWRCTKVRVGMRLCKCPDCNISVKIVFETISVSTWESKIKSVEFIRKGSKRGN